MSVSKLRRRQREHFDKAQMTPSKRLGPPWYARFAVIVLMNSEPVPGDNPAQGYSVKPKRAELPR